MEAPKVYLISATPNPRAILKLCWEIITSPGFPQNYQAHDITELGGDLTYTEPSFDPNTPESDKIVEEFLKSGLGGPLEMINFVFAFEGVTRAFTHQMVRTRLASYMQQSQRFTNFEDGLVIRTPSRVLNHKQKTEDGSTAEEVWGSAIDAIDWACKQLKAMGVATEDLRGLYPTNVTTNIVQAIDFNALRHLLHHRLCTQAQQEEWGSVAKQIKKIVTDYDPLLGEALVPACAEKGKCDFNTTLDRPCQRRDSLPVKVSKSKLHSLSDKTGLSVDEILKEIQ